MTIEPIPNDVQNYIETISTTEGGRAELGQRFIMEREAFGTNFIVDVNGNLQVVNGDYIQLIDNIGAYIYIGNALPSTLTSAESWKIKRIDSNGNTLFAGGVSTFTQVWDNRASLSYA